jgi:integrase
MASNYHERLRWRNHLAPLVGRLQPNDIDVATLKTVISSLRVKGLSKGSVGLCIRLLSSLYGDLVEDGSAKLNPVKMLSRKTHQRDLRSGYDSKLTPFVRDAFDIGRIYRGLNAMNASLGVAYAVGALAGPRTNELRAIRVEDVNLAARTITIRGQVRRSTDGSSDQDIKVTKGKTARVVPILDALFPILENHLKSVPPEGFLCASLRGGRRIDDATLRGALKKVLAELQIPDMTWGQATRHTFGSQYVMAGGSLTEVKEVLGHTQVALTEKHYVHLVPGRFNDIQRGRISI